MTDRPFQRFVILHHTGFGREHWDLMLDDGERLATWQLYHDPRGPLNEAWKLSRIGDHRRDYLTHEGPVSAGRGEVRRVCAGRYQLLDKTSRSWRIRLESDLLSGEFLLEDTPDGWRMGRSR